MSKGMFTYTTQIEPEKTIGEIQQELAKHEAKSVKIDYKNGQPFALSFLIDTPSGEIGIRLPCNHAPVLRVLEKQYEERKISRGFVSEEQAYRISWRVVLYWIKAQMAILETEMVTIDQIFLPYMLIENNKTLYQKMLDTRFQITDGGK
jgi:hypothetical protein